MLSSPSLPRIFHDAVAEHMFVVAQLELQYPALLQAAAQLSKAVLAGRKILWCGNGGSAADAQHLAAELVGRFKRERRGLASVALTTDSSALTAIANDFGYEYVFARQVEALCQKEDVVVGISTSGNSTNVVHALRKARDLGACTVALTGASGGRVAEVANIWIGIASSDTARVQEAHILCGHLLCDWIERTVSRPSLELVGEAHI